jgi:N-acetylglucosamine kinase-like BadF-type ATPase
MMLIAESGATKTTWARIEKDGEASYFTTDGLSPVMQTQEQIVERIKTQLMPNLPGYSPDIVVFYGTGVSSADRIAIMKNALHTFFPLAALEVEHDLLAAARAAYAGETTIVAILGTGSSTCVFDGDKIIAELPAPGFILGDEGSGSYMGKALVRDVLYNKMPANVRTMFKKEYTLDKNIAIDHVYKQPDPARWLASFTKFIHANIEEEYCKNLVLNSFRQFFEYHISAYSAYKQSPMNVIGSIAFYFREQLEQVCSEYEFTFGRVIQAPIEELVKFHLKKQEAA